MAGLLVLLSLAQLAFAFSNTHPLIAWSLYPTTNLQTSRDLLGSILLSEEICQHDSVVLIDHPGLHASDLRGLSPSSHIARSLSNSSSSLQYPYLPNSSSDNSTNLALYAESVSERCHSRLVSITLDQADLTFSEGEKHVVMIEMPVLEMDGRHRGAKMSEHDLLLASTLSALSPHLVIYQGSPLPSSLPHKRSEPAAFSSLARRAPSDEKKTGYLHTHQLLTPGLIITLLIFLFVLLPIVLFSIQALASLQSPIIKEAPRGFSAAEKKNQ